MTINDVIGRVEHINGLENMDVRSDGIKYGNPQKECTGAAVTCFASAKVIREAAWKQANLVICHESPFFGDEYDPGDFENNLTLDKKMELLDETGIVLYRYHDRMHGTKHSGTEGGGTTDLVFYGIMKKLHWENYARNDRKKPTWYTIPEIKAGALAEELMEKFRLDGCRIIGDPDAAVKEVYFAEHCLGRKDLEKINKAVHADAVIPLECVDWTMSEYIADSAYLGIPKVMIQMGHFNTEEAGIEYFSGLLKSMIPVPVYFLPSGDLFRYMVREENDA